MREPGECIGSGVSRLVYAIRDDKRYVLKFSRNGLHYMSNFYEWALSTYHGDYAFMPVVDYHDDFSCIVQLRGEPIRSRCMNDSNLRAWQRTNDLRSARNWVLYEGEYRICDYGSHKLCRELLGDETLRRLQKEHGLEMLLSMRDDKRGVDKSLHQR